MDFGQDRKFDSGKTPVDLYFTFLASSDHPDDQRQFLINLLFEVLDSARTNSGNSEILRQIESLRRALGNVQAAKPIIFTNNQQSLFCDAIEYQTYILDQSLEDIKDLITSIQGQLASAVQMLKNPRQTEVLELLPQIQKSVEFGSKEIGRQRDGHYEDALRLLKVVLDNPIGSLNHWAWFQQGCLEWMFRGDLGQAEQAFFSAVRLSGEASESIQAFYLWNLAHIHYQGNEFEEACNTCRTAVQLVPDSAQYLMDLARFAIRAGRVEEAAQALDRCIDRKAQTIVTMFAELDFINTGIDLESLSACKTEEARKAGIHQLERLNHSVLECKNVFQEVGMEWAYSRIVEERLSSAKEVLLNASYLEVRAEIETLSSCTVEVEKSATKNFAEAIESIINEVRSLERRLDELKKAHANEVRSLEQRSLRNQSRINNKPEPFPKERFLQLMTHGFAFGVAIAAVSGIIRFFQNGAGVRLFWGTMAFLFGCWGWLIVPVVPWLYVTISQASMMKATRESVTLETSRIDKELLRVQSAVEQEELAIRSNLDRATLRIAVLNAGLQKLSKFLRIADVKP